MLRITEVARSYSAVSLKLEGRIACEWASLLEEHCMTLLERTESLRLDLSGVSFIEPLKLVVKSSIFAAI